MSPLLRGLWQQLVWVSGIAAFAAVAAGCAQARNAPTTLTPAGSRTPITTAQLGITPAPALTRTPAVTADVRTPAAKTVEARLAVAPDSSGASFAVRNARGDVIFKTEGSLDREAILYLPPGEYTWSAQVPVPTAPLGCFIVEENSGFWKDGSFTAVRERVEIEVRFVYVVSFCTATPGTP